MVHIVLRARDGSLLFHTWGEAAELWSRLVSAFPGVLAMVLMPDHVHLVLASNQNQRLAQVASGYARWRNHRRGESGPVFAPRPEAVEIPDALHLQRTIRYIHLNPCRAGLVDDPLEWPFSTHRDAVGLAWPPVRRIERDPVRFHSYVSGDPTVSVEGTSLPWGSGRLATVEAAIDAVSAVTRSPRWPLVGARSKARSECIAVCRAVTGATGPEIAAAFGVGRSAVSQAGEPPTLLRKIVERVWDDARFEALDCLDLRLRRRWSRYRSLS